MGIRGRDYFSMQNSSISKLMIVIFASLLSSLFLLKFIVGNQLWVFYFFCLLVFGLLFLIYPFKQRMVISLFVITIPFNITKHFGDFVIDSNSGFIWQSGFKALAYFSINEVLVFTLVLLVFISHVIRNERLFNLKTDIIFIFFLLSVIVSVLFNYDSHGFGLKEIRLSIYFFSIYYYCSRKFSIKDNFRDVFYCLSLILGFEILISFFQILSMNMPFLKIIGGAEQMIGFDDSSIKRVSGTFGHPNGFSSFMVMLLPIVFSGGILLKGKKQFLSGLFILLGALMVFYSYSRSGWIALIVQTILFLTLGKDVLPKWFFNKFLWLVGGIIVFVLIGANWENIYFRFFSQESSDAAFTRITQSKVALHYIKNNLLFGVGPGNYEINLNAADRILNVKSYGLAVHNIYLKYFAERGLFGIMAYLSIYFVTIKHLIDIIRSKHQYSIIALGLLAAIIGHMIQNMFELAETVGTISIFLFFIFGISCSIKIDDQHTPKVVKADGLL